MSKTIYRDPRRWPYPLAVQEADECWQVVDEHGDVVIDEIATESSAVAEMENLKLQEKS